MNIEPRPQKGQRPDRVKTHRLTWDLPRKPHERRKRRRETFHGTKTEAQARWLDVEAEINKAGPGYVAPSQQPLNDWLDKWLQKYAPQGARVRADYPWLPDRYVRPDLGTIPLRELTAARLREWIDALSRRPLARGEGVLSARTVALARAVLRSALSEAVRQDLIPLNPVTKVRWAQPRSQPVTSYELSDMLALWEATRDDHPWGTFWLLAWQGGFRLGELLALQWQDWDPDAGTIQVVRQLQERHEKSPVDVKRGSLIHGRMIDLPKSHASHRTLRATPDMMLALVAHREWVLRQPKLQDTPWVFASPRTGPPLWRNKVYQAWHRAVVAANLSYQRPHALRHTCGSLLIQSGADITTVSQFLGHESITITARVYAHLLRQTKELTVARFASMIEEAKEARGSPSDH